MPGNTFGQILRLTSFGESHGAALGGILDGFPPGIIIDQPFLQQELDRRRPGQSQVASPRKEKDQIEILSGIFEGKSTGSPIAFIFMNIDQKSSDYAPLENTFRPSHADYTYHMKYGIADHRGGGRASARETIVRVAAGAFAKMLLKQTGVEILGFTIQIGDLKVDPQNCKINTAAIDKSIVRCPDPHISELMVALLQQLRQEGDSTGGIVECYITGCTAGLGEPVFDKLNADLGKAMMSINAAKGFEVGSGFKAAAMKGSEHNDLLSVKNGNVVTRTNHSGGIQGGISNGEPIVFRVAFKPPSSIAKQQPTIDKHGNKTEISIKGRHDTCVVPRAVPVVEAMAALVVADHYLRNISTAAFVNK